MSLHQRLDRVPPIGVFHLLQEHRPQQDFTSRFLLPGSLFGLRLELPFPRLESLDLRVELLQFSFHLAHALTPLDSSSDTTATPGHHVDSVRALGQDSLDFGECALDSFSPLRSE